jgi:hypothetical protein
MQAMEEPKVGNESIFRTDSGREIGYHYRLNSAAPKKIGSELKQYTGNSSTEEVSPTHRPQQIMKQKLKSDGRKKFSNSRK